MVDQCRPAPEGAEQFKAELPGMRRLGPVSREALTRTLRPDPNRVIRLERNGGGSKGIQRVPRPESFHENTENLVFDGFNPGISGATKGGIE